MKDTEKRISRLLHERKTLLFALFDSENIANIADFGKRATACDVDAFLVGGSTASDQLQLDHAVKTLKENVKQPVILFPGNITGISRHADAIFFSSLLNSDDPYFIIGAQALGSLVVKNYNLEAIPMGYIIAGPGAAAGFVGRARPFPENKPELVALYALAAQYLGMRFIYLEAGSGASATISIQTIKAVRKVYDGTLIVGGGIRSAQVAHKIAEAGADIIVIGNMLETANFEHQLKAISQAIHSNTH